MVIRKGFKVRIYPTKEQAALLDVQFGCARFVYNHFLAARRDYFQAHKDDPDKRSLNYHETALQLTQLKKQPEYAWLMEAHSQVLQQSLMNLDRAYKNFFTRKAKYPRFKKKRADQSIRFPQSFFVLDRHIAIPKIGKVKARGHRPLEGTPKNLSISKTKPGRYYAAVQVQVEVPNPQPKDGAVGIDLGLQSFLVTSDAQEVPSPRYLLQAHKRLVRLQRRKKGSRGREKARQALARQHEKVANQRKDFIHKVSFYLAQHYGLIGMEDLHVRGMLKNHPLAKAISDAGWGQLKRQLAYKCDWYGSELVEIERFFPSSKRCSTCHYLTPDLPLNVRKWICPSCGTHHDRDHNPAVNILQETLTRAGSAQSYAEGESVSPTHTLAVLSELGSHPLKQVVLH